MTQLDAILALLRSSPEGITPRQALAFCGSMRLAARIADLRADGHVIDSQLITVHALGGRPVRVARYTLLRERVAA